MTFAEFLDQGAQLLALVVLAIGAQAVRRLAPRLADWLHLESDAKVRAYLEKALAAAVDFGLKEARRRMPATAAEDPAHGAVTGRALELAMDYALHRVPDALKRFGLTGPNLRDYVLARLPWPEAQVPVKS